MIFKLCLLGLSLLSLVISGEIETRNTLLPTPTNSIISEPDELNVLHHQFRLTDLKSGDIVFRAGRSLYSRTLPKLDHSPYSHVGIVHIVANQPVIIHASAESPNASSPTVVAESLPTFLKRDQATRLAIYRLKPRHAQVAQLAAQKSKNYADQALAFDKRFDLGTADQLYCTELVWRAYLESGLNLLDPKTFSEVTAGSQSALALSKVIRPKHLLHSPYLRAEHIITLSEEPS